MHIDKIEMILHDKKYIVVRKILPKELVKIYYDYIINKEKSVYHNVRYYFKSFSKDNVF